MRGLLCIWYLERKQDRLELVTSINHGAMLTEVTVLKEGPFRASLLELCLDTFLYLLSS